MMDTETSPVTAEGMVPVEQGDRDAEFLRDLARRIFQHATPQQGFDQGDVDQLCAIARRIAAEQAARADGVDEGPVAWMYEHPEGYRNATARADMRETYVGWLEFPLYRRREAAHAEPRSDEDAVERVWEALKAQCCADPAQAKRCVMVGRDDLRAALAAMPAAIPAGSPTMDEVAKLRVAWDWLAANPAAELSYGRWDDDAEWVVHLVNGGRNDQEWKLIAEGRTPLEAVLNARAKSQGATDQREGGA